MLKSPEMRRAVVYPIPFVTGRDSVIADREINLHNETDQEWLASQCIDGQYVTLTVIRERKGRAMKGQHTVTTRTGYGDEHRVTLRLSRIKELRPDYSHQQAVARAESLAAYCDSASEAAACAANMELIDSLEGEGVVS